jgi:DNA-binding NtrC family response regulator
VKSSKDLEKILVVDDTLDTLEMLQRNLSIKGFQVFVAISVSEAINLLESTDVDLVITDFKMPGDTGLDLIKYIRENFNEIEVMMITGYPTINGAVEAVKSGAVNYLVKPFTQEELFNAVNSALDNLKLRRKKFEKKYQPLSSFRGLIGESDAIKTVFRAIQKAASTTATALITGESGTGKELVAREIHYKSSRSSAPFVPVNCGGIPDGLLESELFGHLKGAFTGATESRAGFFQTADGGTIFLDEISETSLAMQVKLLRVLQDKEICMVGSRRPQKIDVRIVAATNKDLGLLVKKSSFREDLFYRLNIITIDIPPLRDRGHDVVLLANYFLLKFSKELGEPQPDFSDEALRVLKTYSWPGNVRELENLIQRLVVMNDGNEITVPDLPPQMRFSSQRDYGLNRTLAEFEKDYIKNVLARVGGNKTRAADILGIDRKTLRNKLSDMKNSNGSQG